MAGHSKFKNIQHRKGAQDKKRAKIFTKAGREIIVSAKLGGGDPDMNPRLRGAIAAARAVNMPNDRIKKAIETAVGKNDGDNFEDIRYEGYGAGGVAIIVEALTDNRNRTAGDVRAAFSKCGGNLGETNSVSFMFDHVGEILYPVNVADADEIFEQAVEAGAENVESNDEYHEITTKPDQLMPITDFLTAKYGAPEKSAVIWRPNVMTEVNEDILRSILKLIDLLEDSDDVQNVTANFSASDELLDKLMAE